jgi:hypothetical protein
MNMYISQPQPWFYMREFKSVLNAQTNKLGDLATPHCADNWQALLDTGYHIGGSEEKLQESAWRAMDLIEASLSHTVRRLSPWASQRPSACRSLVCGCDTDD